MVPGTPINHSPAREIQRNTGERGCGGGASRFRASTPPVTLLVHRPPPPTPGRRDAYFPPPSRLPVPLIPSPPRRSSPRSSSSSSPPAVRHASALRYCQEMDIDPGADEPVPEVPIALTGNSKDVGWKYGKYCDPTNKSKVKCDFCGHISTGRIYRFKKHISTGGIGLPSLLLTEWKKTSDNYNSSADVSDSPHASETEEGTAEETKSQEHPLKEKRSCKPRKQRRLQPN